MSDVQPTLCDHPTDAPVLAVTRLEDIRCFAHFCPFCRQWFRLSDDYPSPRYVHEPRSA